MHGRPRVAPGPVGAVPGVPRDLERVGRSKERRERRRTRRRREGTWAGSARGEGPAPLPPSGNHPSPRRADLGSGVGLPKPRLPGAPQQSFRSRAPCTGFGGPKRSPSPGLPPVCTPTPEKDSRARPDLPPEISPFAFAGSPRPLLFLLLLLRLSRGVIQGRSLQPAFPPPPRDHHPIRFCSLSTPDGVHHPPFFIQSPLRES